MLHLSPSAKLKPRWFAQSSHSPLLPEHAWYRLEVDGGGGPAGGGEEFGKKGGLFLCDFLPGKSSIFSGWCFSHCFCCALVLCRGVRRKHLHTHTHAHTRIHTNTNTHSLPHTHTHTHTQAVHTTNMHTFSTLDELKMGIKFHAHFAISCACF
jgi:hypothetical protein